jgi:deazaflavin-dependent oxidoreductase (nitroreductase family)
MALPRRLARFNRVVTNRLTRPFAAFLPGFAVVVHTGRRSGREYRTPVNAFRRAGGRTGANGFVIVLTYTSNTDWVANVLAAGGCRLIYLGREIEVCRPALSKGREAKRLFPVLLRPLLRVLGVDEALSLAAVSPDPSDRLTLS